MYETPESNIFEYPVDTVGISGPAATSPDLPDDVW